MFDTPQEPPHTDAERKLRAAAYAPEALAPILPLARREQLWLQRRAAAIAYDCALHDVEGGPTERVARVEIAIDGARAAIPVLFPTLIPSKVDPAVLYGKDSGGIQLYTAKAIDEHGAQLLHVALIAGHATMRAIPLDDIPIVVYLARADIPAGRPLDQADEMRQGLLDRDGFARWLTDYFDGKVTL